MAQEVVIRKSPSASARKRERKDTRPQEIVTLAFEELAAKGYAATRLGELRARQQRPPLSLLQDGGEERHHPRIST
jgi:hypothetical protein